jgi:O-antigen/teichoic acid export membrane protein
VPDARAADDKRVIVRNTLANSGVQLLQLAAAFVYMPFLISSFGLANYGVFMLAGSLSVYIGLLDFGVNPTVVKHVAEYVASGRRSELSRLISNSAAYYSVVGLVAALALTLFARYGVGLLALGPGDTRLASSLFMVSACVALFVWPLATGAAVLNGLQRYDLTAAVNASVVVGNVVATAIVLLVGAGPLVLFSAMGLVSVVTGGVSCLLAARQLPGTSLSVRLVNRSGLRTLLSFGWMLFVMQLAIVLADQRTDRLVLAAFVGAAAVGLYDPAARLNGLVAQLASLPSSALIPAASKLDAESRPEALRSLYLRGSKYTVLFVTPIAVTLIVLAHPLLLAWLGPELAVMSLGAQVFLVTYLMYANLTVAFPILIGTGRLRFVAWYSLGTAALNIVLSLALVGEYGVLGVIVGTVAADTLLFPLGMWYVLKTMRIRGADYLRAVVMRAYPLLLVPLLITVGARAANLTMSLLAVGAVLIVAVSAYWLLAYLLSLDAHEREDLQALLVRMRRGLRGSGARESQ